MASKYLVGNHKINHKLEFNNLHQLLENGIKQLGLVPTAEKINQLIAYVELLLKWNKIYSLTAITDIGQVVTHHILDGLTSIQYMGKYSKIIDVGSGMGVPGVIIAIWYPDRKVTLLDSNNKKTTFLQQLAIELSLHNLHIVTSRVELYKPEVKYDMVISRAFADVYLFVDLSKHLLQHGGVFIAMKSAKIIDELNKLPKQYKFQCINVKIPGITDKRILLKIENI